IRRWSSSCNLCPLYTILSNIPAFVYQVRCQLCLLGENRCRTAQPPGGNRNSNYFCFFFRRKMSIGANKFRLLTKMTGFTETLVSSQICEKPLVCVASGLRTDKTNLIFSCRKISAIIPDFIVKLEPFYRSCTSNHPKPKETIRDGYDS
ncbi:hypothetical protein L9F63_003771, partial [Diploptera punctata]